MKKLSKLRSHLRPGEVFRRESLSVFSTAVDRHLSELLADGTLEKLSQGLYYVPKTSVFGKVPPDEKKVVKAFLKEDKFLLTSPNAYNSLGVGTTQLYNERVVYNRKRHEEVKLGNRVFHFKKKPDFPKTATEEFLLVDLVNNLDQLAEDQNAVLDNVKERVGLLDSSKMKRALTEYGHVRTQKLLSPFLA
jgi:hypothetical protein